MAGPLVEPARVGRIRPVPRAATITRVVGVLLCLLALGGAAAWIVNLSPLHFQRWRSVDTAHNITFTEPGRYVLFEEGDGAAGRTDRPSLMVGVRSVGGKVVPVTNEVDGTGESSSTYQLPFVQGRAIASFDIDKGGRYVILTFPAGEAAPRSGSSDPDLGAMRPVALARAGEPSGLGDLRGLLLVAGVPGLIGVGILLVARSAWPSPVRRATTTRADRAARRAARRAAA